MADNYPAQFAPEGQPAFTDDTEKDTPPSSPEGQETTTDQTGVPDQNKNQDDNKTDGEDQAFYKHPAWIERENTWKQRYNDQESRHANETQQFRTGMETSIADAVTAALKQAGVTDRVSEDVPDWFGSDDPNVWKSYQTHTQQLIQSAVEQALKQINLKTAEEQKAIDDATKWFKQEVETIESDKALNPEGLKVDRNKLLKTALDNELVDIKGRWNYRAAFRMMKPGDIFQAKQALKDRKQIAGASTDNTRADQKPPAFTSSQDFDNPSNRPW